MGRNIRRAVARGSLPVIAVPGYGPRVTSYGSRVTGYESRQTISPTLRVRPADRPNRIRGSSMRRTPLLTLAATAALAALPAGAQETRIYRAPRADTEALANE